MIHAEEYFQLLKLYYTPGETLHQNWWDMLGLTEWSGKYRNLSSSARKKLDEIIIQRRNTAIIIPDELNPGQSKLLSSLHKLPRILIGMGILNYQCPEYLLSREYREALLPVLDNDTQSVLLTLWRGGDKAPVVEPVALADKALKTSCARLTSLWQEHDPIWNIVKFTLPIVDTDSSKVITCCDDLSLFLRLERFL